MSAEELCGRVAVITGAARGIGFGIAEALCARGMTVALNDIDARGVEAAAAQLSASGYSASGWAADLSRSAEVSALFEKVTAEVGPLWLLVNNAGVYHSAPAAEFPEEMWDREFEVDAKAVFLCSKEAIRRMIPRRAGRIVVVASIAGQIVRTQQIAYCAAKAAAIHFSRCLAVEMAPHGITVNCLCPGMTETEMLHRSAAERNVAIAEYEAMIPSGRLARVEDHAETVAWLASAAAGHITGQVIAVDGAQSLYHPLTR